jgi:hypothetical protein
LIHVINNQKYFYFWAGYIFPVLLLAMVSFRAYVLWSLFQEEDIQHLDPDAKSEEDFHKQQHCIIYTCRNSASDNEEEAHIPSHAKFRCKGSQKAMQDHTKLQVQTIFLPGGTHEVIDNCNDDSKFLEYSVKATGDDPEALETSNSI